MYGMTTNADFSECASCFCLASRQAARTITRVFDRKLRPHGIRATQFSVLAALSIGGRATVGDLAEALGLDRTTLSRNLTPIEAQGWVRSRPGEHDARSRYLEITPNGTALLARAMPAWHAAQKAIAATIGDPAAKGLVRLAQHAMR